MRKRILIIDDSPTSRFWLQTMLGKEEFDIHSAKDGEEGLARAAESRPDLVLLDVIMPGMDGFAVCRRLRMRSESATIPIIMVTTRGEAVNVEQGYESGCTDYVTKPIDRLELLAKVRSHLGAGLAEVRA